MKLNKFYLFIICIIFTGYNSLAQFSRIQFANNCPDNAFQGIDVYVNGAIFQDDINFRYASPFMDILPGTVTIAVAPDNSTSVTDAFYTTTIVLTPQDTVIAVANGTRTSAGYNPYQPFILNLYTTSRETAHDPNNTDLLFVNGITDAGLVDFKSGIDTWINNLGFGGFNGYHEFTYGNPYTFRVTNKTGSITYGTYDLTTLPTWAGQSGIVINSGFLSPSNNNNGVAFGPMIVFSAGGPFQPLTVVAPQPYARTQLIHNCADTTADTIDVYVNNQLTLNDMPYLTATDFMDAPANTPLDIGIAPKNSTSPADIFYTLNTTFDSAGTYILVTHGIESTSGYNPAPPFSIEIYNQAKEIASANTSTDILFMGGSTDKPGFNIEQGTNNWVNNLIDGDFSSYITKPTADYNIILRDAGTPTDSIMYAATLQTLGYSNKVITILSSGFKNPGNNSNGHPFGLYVATSEAGPLVPLQVIPPPVVGIKNTVNNENAITLYPNPATDYITLKSQTTLKNTVVTFYTTLGAIAKSVPGNSGSIYIGDLNKGIYFISVTTNDVTQQFKLLKL